MFFISICTLKYIIMSPTPSSNSSLWTLSIHNIFSKMQWIYKYTLASLSLEITRVANLHSTKRCSTAFHRINRQQQKWLHPHPDHHVCLTLHSHNLTSSQSKRRCHIRLDVFYSCSLIKPSARAPPPRRLISVNRVRNRFTEYSTQANAPTMLWKRWPLR